jgi:hypothetical protein
VKCFIYLLKKLLLPAPGFAHIPELRHSSIALMALSTAASLPLFLT